MLKLERRTFDAIMETTKNPVKQCRELLGYSQEELSYQSGINRQVIVRSEQGLYVTIPPRLAAYLSARTGLNINSLHDDYIAWVDENRRNAFGKLSSRLPEFSTETHPFIAWREDFTLSRIEFAKLFCVHLSTLGRFETDLRQASVPDQLVEALLMAGYPLELIHDLKVRYKLWRNYQLALKSNNPERLAKANTAVLEYLKPPVVNEKLSA